MEKYILSVLVKNNAGVLARVSSLFGRRGYNIDSLTVSATNNPAVSRITIVVKGDAYVFEQLAKQVYKLEETIDVYPLKREDTLLRELLLVKVKMDAIIEKEVTDLVIRSGANMIDVTGEAVVIELTGPPRTVNAFMEQITRYPVLEVCRTGVTAMERGVTKHETLKNIL